MREIEQLLHQRWNDAAALEALLPSRRVTTGRSLLNTLPRAAIGRRSRSVVCRTNLGEVIEQIVLEVRLEHEEFDRGAAIVGEFLRVFDRKRFPLSGGAKVLQLRRAEDDCRQRDDGVWQFRVAMVARVWLPAEAAGE